MLENNRIFDNFNKRISDKNSRHCTTLKFQKLWITLTKQRINDLWIAIEDNANGLKGWYFEIVLNNRKYHEIVKIIVENIDPLKQVFYQIIFSYWFCEQLSITIGQIFTVYQTFKTLQTAIYQLNKLLIIVFVVRDYQFIDFKIQFLNYLLCYFSCLASVEDHLIVKSKYVLHQK